MANSTLQVLIDIKSQLSGLEAAVAQMRQLKAETAATASAGSTLQSVIAGFAGGIAVSAVSELSRIPAMLTAAIADGVRFNATLESSQLGIAAIVKQFDQSGRIKNFDDAIAASTRTLDILRSQAKQTAATFEELVQGFQANAGPLFQAGINNAKQQVDVVVAASQAMSALGIPTNQLNQELRALFQGDVSRNSRLNQVLQITKEQIDAAVDSGTAYQLIMQKLASFAEAGARAQNTLNTRLSNFSDITTELKAVGTTELFELIRVKIGEINNELSRPETAQAVRVAGAIMVEALKEVRTHIGYVVAGWNELAKIPGTLPFLVRLAGAALADSGAAAQARWQEFNREQARAITGLREQISSATTLEEREKARTAVAQRVVELIDREKKATGEMKMYLQDAVAETVRVGSDFSSLVGTTEQVGRNINAIVASLEKATAERLKQTIAGLQADAAEAQFKIKIDNEVELARVRATGNEDAIRAEQTRQQVQAKELDFVKAYGEEAGKLKTAEYEGHLRSADAIAKKNEVAKSGASAQREQQRGLRQDVSAYMREQETALQNIRQQQQLISESPFLSIDQKQSALLQLAREQIAALNEEVARGRALIAGGTLDPATYEQVAQKIQQARFEVELLSQKTQTLSFGGELKSDLVQWANNFGTAAHQVGQAITGSINTALDATTELLTDAIFRTGNWRQTVLQAEKAIVGSLIKIGLQMLAQWAISKFINKSNVQDQTQGNTQILATAAPTAIAQSIATSGSAAVIGGIAAAAAIALIMALLTSGFEHGGYTGNVGAKTVAGVVHGQEFVYPKRVVDYYGKNSMQALLELRIPADRIQEMVGSYRYNVAPRLGSFDTGGAVASVANPSNQSAGKSATERPIYQAFFGDNRKAAAQWLLEQPEGQKQMIDFINGNSHQIG